jgi:hypothetical protein
MALALCATTCGRHRGQASKERAFPSEAGSGPDVPDVPDELRQMDLAQALEDVPDTTPGCTVRRIVCHGTRYVGDADRCAESIYQNESDLPMAPLVIMPFSPRATDLAREKDPRSCCYVYFVCPVRP